MRYVGFLLPVSAGAQGQPRQRNARRSRLESKKCRSSSPDRDGPEFLIAELGTSSVPDCVQNFIQRKGPAAQVQIQFIIVTNYHKNISRFKDTIILCNQHALLEMLFPRVTC